MKRMKKRWLIAAGALVLVGALIAVLAMCLVGWDLTKLSTETYETKTYEPSDPFDRIRLTAEVADVVFCPSEDGTCRVVCRERETVPYAVTVEDGVLTVRPADNRKWQIGVSFEGDRITVYLPEATYAALTVENQTGAVTLSEGLHFGSIDISVSTGDVTCRAAATGAVRITSDTGAILVEHTAVGSLETSTATGRVTVSDVASEGDVKVDVSTGRTALSRVTCRTLTADGSTGSITLRDVVATERFWIRRDTGSVTFEGCDAAEITVKTDTGDVKGTLLTPKLFAAKSDTGRVSVPNTTGGKCEIITDTGDIRITVQ